MAIDPRTDCYAILGVPPDAEQEAIRAAYEELAQRYQPDRFSGSREEAERRLSDLTTAYGILADPLQRRRYDYHRRVYAKTASFEVRDPSRPGRAATAAVRPPASPPDTGAGGGTPDRATVTRVGPRRSRAFIALAVGGIVVAAAIGYRYSGRDDAPPAAPRTTTASPADAKPGANPPAAPTASPTGAPDAAPASAKAASVPSSAMPSIDPGAVPRPDSDAPPRAVAVPRPASEAKDASTTPRAGAPAAAAASLATSPPGETLRDDARRASPKSAAARGASANRAPPAGASSEPCSDVVTALGLCKSNPPLKDK